MAVASSQQVQKFVNERIRPRAEQVRALLAALQDDKAAIDDIYAAVSAKDQTWTDDRTDGPPHLITGNDVLAYNSFITFLIPNIRDAADYPTVLRACVRAPGS